MGVEPHHKTVAYVRVSSNGQKENLKHQMSFIRNKLLDKVEAGKIEQIFVTYKDRFARFGFDWFEHFCSKHDTKIIVLNNPETSPDKEMVDDLISVVHVFSCRLYGLRRCSKLTKQDLNKVGESSDHKNQNISTQTQSKDETGS